MRIDTKPVDTPQKVTTDIKQELKELAAEKKNPKLETSFSALLARKSAQVF